MLNSRRLGRSAGGQREDILAAAMALFFERGYEAATIADIVDTAGVSRDEFDRHFASKDDALEALSLQMSSQVLARVQPILESPVLSPYERLNDMLTTMRHTRAAEAKGMLKAFGTLFSPDNLALYHKINRAACAKVAPVFEAIIEEGAEDGTFMVTGDPRTTADILLCLGTASYDAVSRAVEALGTPQAEEAARCLQNRLDALGLAADRILGLPDGSIRFAEPGYARALLGL